MVHDRREQNASVASFLLPEGYRRPRADALLKERSVVSETVRMVAGSATGRRRRRAATTRRLSGGPGVTTGGSSRSYDDDPVLLIPGFLAGDPSLAMMNRGLRSAGFRTYRAHIHANIGCTRAAVTALEARVESIAIRRGSRVALVGHSLGGMLARGLAVRRPDLVSGIVTMGSPMLAPGAHHVLLTAGLDALVRLSSAGVPGLMSSDCVAGQCARDSFEEIRRPVPAGVGFTAIYSPRDGIVDWRACADPEAQCVEMSCSHLGMAVDPRVLRAVIDAMRDPAYVGRAPVAAWPGGPGSVLEIDRGESA